MTRSISNASAPRRRSAHLRCAAVAVALALPALPPLALGGCIDPEDILRDAGIGGPPPNSVEVAPNIYLVGGEVSDEPFPAPSQGGGALSIEGYAHNTGAHSFAIVIESTTVVEVIHLEFNGIHYVVPPTLMGSGQWDPVPIDVCQLYVDAGGAPCTEACLQACGCLSCSDDVGGDILEGSCAATCSQLVATGAIESAPYDGSEAIVADVLYNGYTADNGHHIDGILASGQFSCNASACSEAAEEAANSYFVGFDVTTDWSFLGDLDGGALIAEGPGPSGETSLTSDNTSPGTLSECCCKFCENKCSW